MVVGTTVADALKVELSKVSSRKRISRVAVKGLLAKSRGKEVPKHVVNKALETLVKTGHLEQKAQSFIITKKLKEGEAKAQKTKAMAAKAKIKKIAKVTKTKKTAVKAKSTKAKTTKPKKTVAASKKPTKVKAKVTKKVTKKPASKVAKKTPAKK
ncbi:MAG: hypothetical protein MHPSP_000208 [Paramarteilia canceri]